MQSFKASAFDWILKILMAIVSVLVMDMYRTINRLSENFVLINYRIDLIEGKQNKLRLDAIPPAKHEEIITAETIKSE